MTHEPLILIDHIDELSHIYPNHDFYPQIFINSTTSYSNVSADLLSMGVHTNAALVNITLPTPVNVAPANSYAAGNNNLPAVICQHWECEHLFLGAAGGKLTPVSGTINGAAFLTVAQGSGVKVKTDGVNWYAIVSNSSGGSSLPGAWTSYTPTLGAATGTLTSASASGHYQQFGKTVFFTMQIDITTNGTAAGYLTATTPTTPAASGCAAAGKEILLTGNNLNIEIRASNTVMIIVNTVGLAYPGANGYRMVVNGTYETT